MIKITVENTDRDIDKYYIYRFKNKPYDANIENYINNYTPIGVLDGRTQSRELVFNDSDANGIYKPEIETVETNDLLSIYIKEESKFNKYSYVLLCKNIRGEISNLSKPQMITLTEDNDYVLAMLESCDNTNVKDPMWKLVRPLKPNDVFNLSKPLEVAVDEISCITPIDIYKDDTTIKAGTRILKILNIFHADNKERLKRKSKAFRIVISSKTEISEPSNEITLYDRFTVNIDKLEVYKQEVSSNNPTLLKRYIRKGGKFETEDGELILKYNKNNFLDIEDACDYTKQYKYTVYLYDEKGNKSNPIEKTF